jgi:hypothetical protein
MTGSPDSDGRHELARRGTCPTHGTEYQRLAAISEALAAARKDTGLSEQKVPRIVRTERERGRDLNPDRGGEADG